MDRNSKVLGSAELTRQKQYARIPPHTHADQKTESIRAVDHQKTVAIRTTAPIYPGPGGGSVLFQGPRPMGSKIPGGGDEAALDVFQVIFYPDDLTISPAAPTNNTGKTDPPYGTRAVPMAQYPTNIITPKSAAPTVIGSGNRVSNCTRTTEGQDVDQEIAADNNSVITSADSSGANDNYSEYVELCENYPARLDKSTDPETIIEEIVEIQNDINTSLEEFPTTTALFTYPHDINPTELAGAETTLDENP